MIKKYINALLAIIVALSIAVANASKLLVRPFNLLIDNDISHSVYAETISVQGQF